MSLGARVLVVEMVQDELTAKTIGALIGLARKEPAKLSAAARGTVRSRGGAEAVRIMAKVTPSVCPYSPAAGRQRHLFFFGRPDRRDLLRTSHTGLPPVLDGRERAWPGNSKQRTNRGTRPVQTARRGRAGFEMWACGTASTGRPARRGPIVDRLNALVREAVSRSPNAPLRAHLRRAVRTARPRI